LCASGVNDRTCMCVLVVSMTGHVCVC